MYRYDSKGQLIYAGTTDTSGMEYTYDANGNILTKKNLSTIATVSYAIGILEAAVLTIGAVGYAICQAIKSSPISIPKGKEKEKDITATQPSTTLITGIVVLTLEI